ncbi:MAG: hypothetical protein ACTJLK_00695 [Anaplasma sp.]
MCRLAPCIYGSTVAEMDNMYSDCLLHEFTILPLLVISILESPKDLYA